MSERARARLGRIVTYPVTPIVLVVAAVTVAAIGLAVGGPGRAVGYAGTRLLLAVAVLSLGAGWWRRRASVSSEQGRAGVPRGWAGAALIGMMIGSPALMGLGALLLLAGASDGMPVVAVVGAAIFLGGALVLSQCLIRAQAWRVGRG